MFRIGKVGLFTLLTIIELILFSTIITQYDQETIPNDSTVIQIVSDKANVNKRAIFSKLRTVAKKENYQLTLVRVNRLNNHVTKSYYDFNPAENHVFSLFKTQNLNKITNHDLQLEDIRGEYFTNASGNSLENLGSTLDKLGIKYNISKVSLFDQIRNDSSTTSYLPIFLSILGILLIVMFMEKVSNFKKYAILKLNGWTIGQILKRDIKSNLPLFVVVALMIELIYLIYNFVQMNFVGLVITLKYSLGIIVLIAILIFFLDLISYLALLLMNLYSAIKGNSSAKSLTIIGYVLKGALLILVSINIFSLVTSLRILHKDQSIMNMWINHHSGYTIGFNDIDETDHEQEAELGKLTKRLIIDNGKNVIISRNSQEFHPGINNITPENGNVMFINPTYLKYNRFYNADDQLIRSNNLANKKVNVLIPYSRKNQIKAFAVQLRDFYDFQKDLSNSNKKKEPKFNFIVVKDNRRVFNYTIGKDIQDSISINPIIVIDNGSLSENFYWSTASQGMVQFLNLKELQKDIKRLGMNKYITGITDARTRLSDFNITMTRRITVLLLTVILSIAQLIVVIIFISMTFLEHERPRLAIRKIFGQSNVKIIATFLLVNVFFDLLIVLMSTLIFKLSVLLLLYLVPYLVLESAVIAILAWYAQKGLLTTINHGN